MERKLFRINYKTTPFQPEMKLAVTLVLGFVATLGALGAALPASASDVFVAQSGAGGNNGADCSNARPVSSLNGGDWAPGNTIHLCGSISTAIRAQGSGSSGSPITILFEPGASFTAPAVPSSGAIVVTKQSWIVVDGGSTVTCGFVNGSNVTCNNGVIQSTANGSGLANQITSIGIEAGGSSNVEIRNLVIGPLYVHSSPNDLTQGGPPGPICIHYVNASNLSIHNNTMHDAAWCMNGGGSNFDIHHNEVYRVDHGVGMGNANTAINIHSNHFHDFANWDTADDSFHHDGIHIFGVTNGMVTGANEYDNLFDGDIGNDATSWIYNEGAIQHINMYNNLASMAPGRYSCCGVFSFWGNGYRGSNNSAFNNTVLGAYVAGSGSCMAATAQTNLTFKNNILIGCQNLIGISGDSTVAPGGLSNNVYEDVGADYGQGGSNAFGWAGNLVGSVSTWISQSGELNAKIGTLQVLGISVTTGRLSAGSLAIGAGTNLTGLGMSTLDADIVGDQRPGGTTPWDAGAYETGGQPPARPAPPTNVTAVAK
jgi:hypothetical protein